MSPDYSVPAAQAQAEMSPDLSLLRAAELQDHLMTAANDLERLQRKIDRLDQKIKGEPPVIGRLGVLGFHPGDFGFQKRDARAVARPDLALGARRKRPARRVPARSRSGRGRHAPRARVSRHRSGRG